MAPNQYLILWIPLNFLLLLQATNQTENVESSIEFISKFQHRIYAVTNSSVFAFGEDDPNFPLLAIESAKFKGPTKIIEFENHKVIQLCSSRRHMLALSDSGHIWAWGSNEQGELGLDSSTKYYFRPVEVLLESNIRSIVCGYFSSFVITQEGEVYSWGWNQYGQLGIGLHDSHKIDIGGVVRLETSDNWMVLALTQSGRVLGWGIDISSEPLQLETGSLEVKDIALVYTTVFILNSSGRIYVKETPKRFPRLFYEGGMRFKAIYSGKNYPRQFLLAESLEGGLLAWWDINEGGKSFTAVTLRELAMRDVVSISPLTFPNKFINLFVSEHSI